MTGPCPIPHPHPGIACWDPDHTTPRQPASQVLAEAASALHSTENTDSRDWMDLTEDEKVPYIARVLRPTLAVLLTTQPDGWTALATEIHAVDHALARRAQKENR